MQEKLKEIQELRREINENLGLLGAIVKADRYYTYDSTVEGVAFYGIRIVKGDDTVDRAFKSLVELNKAIKREIKKYMI